MVSREIDRLKRTWGSSQNRTDSLEKLLESDALDSIDPFDRIQLAYVVDTCRSSRSLSDAGRKLFAASRQQRSSTNDADRLRKYLNRFALDWHKVAGHGD